jgi:ligand-binding sensor domain-containing protein/signal transduction histidine kinase
MRNWLLIPFMLLMHLFVKGQAVPFSFRNMSINEGLSQSSVIDIATDDAGFLWLATQDGLNRYDGRELVIFKKNFDDITTTTGSRLGKIVNGRNNTLWLITSGGRLEQLNLYNETFTPIRTIGPDSIVLPPVSCLHHDKDNTLWIGTENNGLYIYDLGANKVTHYITPSIQYLFKDSRQQYWILTNRGVTLLSTENGQPVNALSFITDSISYSAMDEDDSNTLWLGTYGKGLYVKKKDNTEFVPFTGFGKQQTLPANLVIESVKADDNGLIWVGTYGNGLYVINPARATVVHYVVNKKDPFSISYNDVLCIKEDKQGGIWIGTDGGGVSHYDKRLNNFVQLTSNNVPENISIEQVRSITTDHTGNVWIGTSTAGLTFANMRKNTFETYHYPPAPKALGNYDRVVSLYTDAQGDIWVGTQGNGLLVVDAVTKKIKTRFYPGGTDLSGLEASLTPPDRPTFIPDHTIWCMQPAPNNQVWVGTRNGGLCLMDKQKGLIRNYNTSAAAGNRTLGNNVRFLTLINDTTLCIGFEKRGIQFLHTRAVTLFTKPNATLDSLKARETIFKCSWYRSPVLWIGTLGQGLIAWNLHTGETHAIHDEQGLPNNTVYGILPDSAGSLWLSTNKGICRFVPPADLKQVSRSNFTGFLAEDGLQSNEFNTGAYHKAADGRLLFGGINGLSIFQPELIALSHQPAQVVITQAMVNNQPLVSDTGMAYKKILHLRYRQNAVSFNFAALDFVSPRRFNYYYQLSGYDTKWIDAGNRNYVAYTNLPPGRYVFMVKAAQQLRENSPVTMLTIIIDPPFWRTWWFILLCVLALAGLLYAVYRYRIDELLRLQKIRDRIATDLHDDIGTTLTNISILSELSKKNLQKEEAGTFLDRIAEEVHNSSQALDDIVWSINTRNDTLEQTVARMRRYTAEIFDGANITYTLQLDEQFEKYKLNMEQRRDIFLIFKEAINNIYKHAHAKHVQIKVWIERGRLHMIIQDDGQGFDTTTATHRNGIKNIRNRIEKWNGHIALVSVPGKGTETRVHFPLT